MVVSFNSRLESNKEEEEDEFDLDLLRSTKIISMIKWIRTSRLSIKISLSLDLDLLGRVVAGRINVQKIRN